MEKDKIDQIELGDLVQVGRKWIVLEAESEKRC